MVCALVALACGAFSPPVIVEAPRLRRTFVNGARALVERLPGTDRISVQLFASARDVPESPATHGFRHLLEHLVARGPRGDVDRRLEREGLFLTAHTFRDALKLQIDGPPSGLDLALEVLAEIARERAFSEEEIRAELRILREEFALVPDEQRVAAAAWEVAFGEKGLDPFGTSSSIARARPEDLQRIARLQFRGPNLAVVVAGEVNLDQTMAKIERWLGSLPAGESPRASPSRGGGTPGAARADVPMSARGAIVEGLDHRETLASLAAGFALQAEIPGARLLYTPTLEPGLVILAHRDPETLTRFLDEMRPEEVDALFPSGQALLLGWLRSSMRDPARLAHLRGMVLVHGSSLRLEDLLGAAARLTADDFRSGAARFRKGAAVEVHGA